MIKRTQKEIDEVLNKAANAMDEGSRYPGMSYEDGVQAALHWVLGVNDDPVFED